MDDVAEILREIRGKLAKLGESPDDYSDDELREALRITLVTLTIEYGGENPPLAP